MAITSGYNVWIQEPRRARSIELSFGAWWAMDGTRWRVSWIEETGELYATELSSSDRFVILGRFENKKNISRKMQHWSEGDNLALLIQSLETYGLRQTK